MKYFMLIFISSVIVFSSCADVTSVNYDEDDPVEAIDVTTEFIKFCDTLLMDCNNEYNLNPAWENLRLKEFVGHHLIIENSVNFVVFEEEEEERKYVSLCLVGNKANGGEQITISVNTDNQRFLAKLNDGDIVKAKVKIMSIYRVESTFGKGCYSVSSDLIELLN